MNGLRVPWVQYYAKTNEKTLVFTDPNGNELKLIAALDSDDDVDLYLGSERVTDDVVSQLGSDWFKDVCSDLRA